MNLNQTKINHIYKLEYEESNTNTIEAIMLITKIKNTYLNYRYLSISSTDNAPTGDISKEQKAVFKTIIGKSALSLIGHKDNHPEYFL